MIFTVEEFFKEVEQRAGGGYKGTDKIAIALRIGYGTAMNALWATLMDSGNIIEIQGYKEDGE